MSLQHQMKDMARKAGSADSPLFAPLARAVACQIEAITPQEMVTDPMQLIKGVSSLRRAAGLDTIAIAAPSTMEAEALGAQVDYSAWPPKVVAPAQSIVDTSADFSELWGRSEALSAAIEGTRRLAPEIDENTLIVAGLTGASNLLRQLLAKGEEPTLDNCEGVTAALAALVRTFGQAGANVIVMHESLPLVEDWVDLYGTIANTAKFLKIPLIVLADDDTDWPRLATPKDWVQTLPNDTEKWGNIVGQDDCRIAVTTGEVPANTPMEKLLEKLALAKKSLGS
jgi:hypothetical protein|tara:strand:+ start:61252 stop:62100 length:849 start_codon:yes stop_codon:yes gene_type:complete